MASPGTLLGLRLTLALAQDDVLPHDHERVSDPPRSPPGALAAMELAEGLVVELATAEPLSGVRQQGAATTRIRGYSEERQRSCGRKDAADGRRTSAAHH